MNKDIQIAVIGAGMIGLSMCALLTGNGIKTKLYVRSNPMKRKEQYNVILSDLEKQNLLTASERINCVSYLKVVTSYEELQDTEVVFECAAEDLDVKHDIYNNLIRYCPFLKVIASTTSAIPAEKLAEGSVAPEKIIVAHPFYPPHLIPGVEVVPGIQTSQDAIACIIDVLKYMNRKPVLLEKDARGFIANRLQYAMLREAVHIVEEKIARPEDVDEILMNSFAPRYTSIGIFEHFDNCGLDLAGNICRELYPDLSGEREVQKLIRQHCEKKEYGIKTGKGIYDWSKKDIREFRKRVEDPYLRFFSWKIPVNKCNWEDAE
ncbi:MAG: 3-hydroxyacyl-CoA dehydrogenase family protein [Blautia sp.]